MQTKGNGVQGGLSWLRNSLGTHQAVSCLDVCEVPSSRGPALPFPICAGAGSQDCLIPCGTAEVFMYLLPHRQLLPLKGSECRACVKVEGWERGNGSTPELGEIRDEKVCGSSGQAGMMDSL